jgi:intein/homing endonuclease
MEELEDTKKREVPQMAEKHKSESAIVSDIKKYLKSLDECFFWKEHGGMYGVAGIPDIICCYKGLFLAFEVKKPDGKLTKLQEKTIKDIQAAGGQAYVVRSVDEVKRIIQHIEEVKKCEKLMTMV